MVASGSALVEGNPRPIPARFDYMVDGRVNLAIAGIVEEPFTGPLTRVSSVDIPIPRALRDDAPVHGVLNQEG